MSGTTAVEASKSTRAYEWIRDRIRFHEYTPGHRLVIAPIAEALGMSAVPVREAIRRLEAEGLVTFEHNVGARVALVDEQEYVHTMQTLGLVEGLATALSAPLLLDADLETRPSGERTDAGAARRVRLHPVHPAEPGLPRGALRAVPEPAPPRSRAPRLGAAVRHPRLHVRLRARPREPLGRGARPDPRPHRRAAPIPSRSSSRHAITAGARWRSSSVPGIPTRTPGRNHDHDQRGPDPAARARGSADPDPALHRRRTRRLRRRVDLRRARPGVEHDLPAGGRRQEGRHRPRGGRRAARVHRRAVAPDAPPRPIAGAAPRRRHRRVHATPGSPSSSPSTPACRSRRRSVRRAAPPRTSGSSPT